MSHPLHQYQTKSDAELLGMIYGHNAEAEALFEQCDGSLCRVLRETSRVYSPGNAVLHAARELLLRSMVEDMRVGDCLGSPGQVRDYLRLTLRDLEHEVFMVLFLDAQNRLLAADEMFRGTITQTSVYPREVVKMALAHNAAAVILAHCHPSGSNIPSAADESLTAMLKQALRYIDVKVLDHIIVAGNHITSFAESGLI